MTATGLDGRILESLNAALEILPKTLNDPSLIGANSLSVPSLIATRCRDILGNFPTTLSEDEFALCTAEYPLCTAIEYRIGKKKILSSALAHFELQK